MELDIISAGIILSAVTGAIAADKVQRDNLRRSRPTALRVLTEDFVILSACIGSIVDEISTIQLALDLYKVYDIQDIVEVKGIWQDQIEASFLVFTKDIVTVMALAKVYEQTAVISNKELFNLKTGDLQSVSGIEFGITAESYTILPSGETFVIHLAPQAVLV